MTHTITIDESQQQMILLALAQLSLQRPGWLYVLGETAKLFPDGDKFRSFRRANDDTIPASKVAEECAKIVEAQDSVKGALRAIREYAADLAKPENMGAARG